MFGQDDDLYTNDQLEALITKWQKEAGAERKAAQENMRSYDHVIAEGCWGRKSAYDRCIADVKKLRGY